MQISRLAGIPLPCVPVSIPETRMSKSETQLTDNDPISLNERTYEVSDAINCLIDAGYRLGCDGELLPPRWAYEAFKGADA